MKKLLTSRARIPCAHTPGHVDYGVSQSFVRIDGAPVLRQGDVEGRPVLACAMTGTNLPPCGTTARVGSGYSSFVSIAGRPVLLSNLRGTNLGQNDQPEFAVSFFRGGAGQLWVGSER